MGEVEILRGAPRFSLEEIRRVVSQACAREGAERALLFGSYARGSADAFSDVDLIVVYETAQPFLERYRAFSDVLDALPGTELLVYTPAEFADLRTRRGFLERAEAEGVVLYDGSEDP